MFAPQNFQFQGYFADRRNPSSSASHPPFFPALESCRADESGLLVRSLTSFLLLLRITRVKLIAFVLRTLQSISFIFQSLGFFRLLSRLSTDQKAKADPIVLK